MPILRILVSGTLQPFISRVGLLIRSAARTLMALAPPMIRAAHEELITPIVLPTHSEEGSEVPWHTHKAGVSQTRPLRTQALNAAKN